MGTKLGSTFCTAARAGAGYLNVDKKLFQVIFAILALALAISNEFEKLGVHISGETPNDSRFYLALVLFIKRVFSSAKHGSLAVKLV